MGVSYLIFIRINLCLFKYLFVLNCWLIVYLVFVVSSRVVFIFVLVFVYVKYRFFIS